MSCHVILIGIDGLNHDRANNPDLAPAITSIMREGSMALMEMPVPTLSGPGWATILTGMPPEVHGITENTLRNHRCYALPDMLSQAFYLNPRTTTCAAAGWPALVDPQGVGPIIHQRREQQLAGIHRVLVRDGETYGYRTVDAEMAEYVDAGIRQPIAPDFTFLFQCSVDDYGHVYGVGDQYDLVIREVDARVAMLTKTIQQRVDEHDEQWLIALTTDHGHVPEGGHGGDSPAETTAFLAARGFGRPNPAWPAQIRPTDVASLLIAELHGLTA